MENQNQQHYSPTPFAAPETPKPFFKPWMFLVAGILAVAVVIIVVIVIRENREQAALLKQQSADAAAVAESVCANAKNKESCVQSRITQSASEIGAVETCGMIQEPVAYDNCVWTVANEQDDVGVCRIIKNSDWNERCKDGIYLQSARETKTLATCEKIIRAETKALCNNELDPLTAGNCVSRGHAVAWCADFATYQNAFETQDRALCETIKTEEFKSACGEISVPDILSDQDNDGLTDLDEKNIYKTDPAKADTDGDGYSDGIEVKSKHNPLGSG